MDFFHCMARGTQSRPFETTLRKHAYSNILKFLQPEKENILTKNSDIFQISVHNIDCGHSLGFTGVYIIFLTSVKKHRLWVHVRTASPRRF